MYFISCFIIVTLYYLLFIKRKSINIFYNIIYHSNIIVQKRKTSKYYLFYSNMALTQHNFIQK